MRSHPIRVRSNGGAEGTRTPDPLDANQVLYQLSYSPTSSTLANAECIFLHVLTLLFARIGE